MSKITKFKDLHIGDVFDFKGCLYVKLSNKYDPYVSAAKQRCPNSISLETKHYTSCSYNAIVTKIKSLKDFMI